MRLPHSALAAALFAVAAPSLAAAQADSTAPATSTIHDSTRVVKHLVKKGDTLWDIAKAYLKDPFRWPEVFHHNTDVVKNPHWIYPGEVLIIDGAAVRDEVSARVDRNGFVVTRVQTRAAEPGTVFQDRDAMMNDRASGDANAWTPPTIRRGEYDAAPYVVSDTAPFHAGRLVGPIDRAAVGRDVKAGLKLYDRMYVTAPPGQSLQTGDQLLIVRRGDEIPDVGRVIEPTGVVRIDSVPATGPALGQLVRQYETVFADQLIVPFVAPATVIDRPVQGTYAQSSSVLWIKGRPVLPTVQTYVVLALADGVRPGDQFTLYDTPQPGIGAQTPPIPTATVQVIRVTDRGATGVVVKQSQPRVATGMMAKLTAKMP